MSADLGDSSHTEPDDAGAEPRKRPRVSSATKQLIAEADRLLSEGDALAAAHLLRATVDDVDAERPPILFLKLGKIYRALSDFEAALAVNGAGAELHPDHIGLSIDAAQLAMERGDLASAERFWQHAIGKDEAPASAHVGLTKVRRRQGDLAGAVAAAEAGAERYPAELANELASARRSLANERLADQIDRGEIPLEDLLEASKRNIEADDARAARQLLVRTKDRLGEDAPADLIFLLVEAQRQMNDQAWRVTAEQGAERYPEHRGLGVVAARAAMAASNWFDASRRWQRLIDRFANELSSDAYVDASIALMKLKRADRAEGTASQGVALHPEDPAMAFEHARVATLAFRYDEAAARWSKAIERFGLDHRSFADHRGAIAGGALIEAGRFADAIGLMQRLREQRGDHQLFLAIEGIALLRQAQYDDAERHWRAFWARGVAGDPMFGRHQRLPYARPTAGNAAFARTEPNDPMAALPADGRRWCVYTAILGGYDRLKPPTYCPPGVDFICFTDAPMEVDGWQVRLVEPVGGNLAVESRRYKVKPFDYLAGYDASLYVDGSVVVTGDVDLFHRRWLRGKDFVAWPHPERSDVFQEIEAILAHQRHPPLPLIAFYRRLRQELLPSQTGVIEGTILWRDHNNQEVRRLMEAWWDGIVETDGRDQPPLAYAMAMTGIRPEAMPPHLGICGANDFFRRTPHRGSPLGLGRERDDDEPDDAKAADRAPVPAVRRGDLQRRLAFVYRPADVLTATIMRGRQLAAFAKSAIDDWQIELVDDVAASELSDSVLILTRSFLRRAKPAELAAFRRRGNVVCADNVDHSERPELSDQVDVYIAASMTQYIDYIQRYPEHEVHLVTHHSDPAIGRFEVPTDRARLGYFGELVNAAHREEFADKVDFFQTNNAEIEDRGWLDALPGFNVHYAVRRRRPHDVYKPFTKGFTAARCGANIVVASDDGDARYYVGNDYPFIVGDSSIETVRDMIAFVEESFGGPEWRRGLDIMASVRRRSSPAQIGHELKSLLDRIR